MNILKSNLADILKEKELSLRSLQARLRRAGYPVAAEKLRQLHGFQSTNGELDIETITNVCEFLGINMGELFTIEKATDEGDLRLIAGYRFPEKKQSRMDELLDKGNSGLITAQERRELDRLINEFEESNLAKARAIDALREMDAPWREFLALHQGTEI